jgi:hypothetical protein
MSQAWVTIVALAVATALIKAAGPVLVGGRSLSPPALRVISLLAPTLLAALVVVQTFAEPDGDLVLDARAAGLAAAGGAIALEAPLAVVVLAGAAAAATSRALGIG